MKNIEVYTLYQNIAFFRFHVSRMSCGFRMSFNGSLYQWSVQKPLHLWSVWYQCWMPGKHPPSPLLLPWALRRRSLPRLSSTRMSCWRRLCINFSLPWKELPRSLRLCPRSEMYCDQPCSTVFLPTRLFRKSYHQWLLQTWYVSTLHFLVERSFFNEIDYIALIGYRSVVKGGGKKYWWFWSHLSTIISYTKSTVKDSNYKN